MHRLSKEYRKFKMVKHWQPANEILLVRDLTNPKNKFGKFFSFLYEKTKKAYEEFPTRKDGTNPFVHPLNLAWDLKKADIDDPVTLSSALLHDYIEEKVDFYKKKHGLGLTKNDVQVLDEYAKIVSSNLERVILQYCIKNKIKKDIVSDIITITNLLTRYKKNYYYYSICTIFTHKNTFEKEKAIIIKLSDRMHNILSIESFTEPERIYQCFKNMFTLNNVKKYILEIYGKKVFEQKKSIPIIRLFKRCAKATYDAFAEILQLSRKKGINEVTTILQLAFRKFELEKAGLIKVTHLDKKEMHPLGLYTGIIEKYNFRLHHKRENFNSVQKRSHIYYQRFFADHKFTSDQLNAIIDYKDAYSLKEVVTMLLYLPGYVLSGFDYSGMFCKMR